MAETPSTMLPLGTSAPNFNLPDPSGNLVSIADFKDAPALLVVFICNHCPFVKHVQQELVRLANDYQPHGVKFAAISSMSASFATNRPRMDTAGSHPATNRHLANSSSASKA